jgi:hypothetical protein
MPATKPSTAPTTADRLKLDAFVPGPWGAPGNLQPAGSPFPTPPAAPVDPVTTGSTAPSFLQSLRDELARAMMGGANAPDPIAAGGPGGGLPGETARDRAALQYNLARGAGHSYAYNPPAAAAAAPKTTGSTTPTTKSGTKLPAQAPVPTPRPFSGPDFSRQPPAEQNLRGYPVPPIPYDVLSSAYLPYQQPPSDPDAEQAVRRMLQSFGGG